MTYENGPLDAEPGVKNRRIGPFQHDQYPERIRWATDAGVETYAFKDAMRTVLYRHSALTGWTYGFGVLHP